MRCKDCRYCREDGINSYFGGGLYWVNYCEYLPHKLKLVDAEVERECDNYSKSEIITDPIREEV